MSKKFEMIRMWKRKDIIFACILIISAFTLVYKLLTPVPLIITVDGATISSVSLPKFFTYNDVFIIIVSSFLLGYSIAVLIEDESITAKNKTIYKVLSTLKENERKIVEILIEHDGVMFQSEIVEKSGLPKSTVSIILDKLEAKGIVERRKYGMSNVVILKFNP